MKIKQKKNMIIQADDNRSYLYSLYKCYDLDIKFMIFIYLQGLIFEAV